MNILVLFFFLFILYLLFSSPNSGITIQMPRRPQAKTLDQNTRQERAFLNLSSSESQDHRQRPHRTKHKGHTPSPKIEIKIPDPAGYRTQAAGLKGRDSIDHAIATHIYRHIDFSEDTLQHSLQIPIISDEFSGTPRIPAEYQISDDSKH